MSQHPNLVEVTFAGWEFADSDTQDLAEAFSPVGTTRATGGWEPAALPAAAVEVVLTFLGQTLLGMLAEKALVYTWHEAAAAWARYREARKRRSLADPELSRFVVRGDDFELAINGATDLLSSPVIDALALLAQRRSTGALRDFPIRRIAMPCIQYGDHWDKLEPYSGSDGADFLVWYVESRYAEPNSSFYDAKADEWIPWG